MPQWAPISPFLPTSFCIKAFVSQNASVLHTIRLVSSPAACNKTIQPAGSLNQSPGPARPEPDVAPEMLIMFVLFTNAAQSKFLISGLSLRTIYTDSHSDMYCKQRGFGFCSVCRNCRSAPWFMAAAEQRGCLCWSALHGEKVQQESLSGS